MRPYKRLTIICGMISFFSLAICLFLHYFVICDESDFWINVCLAVFGSALLSALTSLITYFHEKRSTLEGFMYHCKYILHALNKYQDSMSLEEKMKFYLEYHDLDKSMWDADYGNMDFFAEKITGNRKYIYEKSIPTDYDETGRPIAFCEVAMLESKLVREISQELDGKYYRIMYGKRHMK